MFQTEIINSLTEFKENSNGCREKWNDLWARSGSHVVMHQAQSLIHFGEAFKFESNFRIIAASQQGKWFTAIPVLLKSNRFGRLEGDGIANEWNGVDALLDDVHQIDLDRFASINAGFVKLGLYKVNLHWLPVNGAATQRLVNAWQEQGRRVWTKPRFFVGKQIVPADWDAYWKQLSKNRRKKINRSEKELSLKGAVSLEEFSSSELGVMKHAFNAAMGIEHASWKGQEKSSLLSHPDIALCMEKNFLNWAEQSLARVYFLKVGDRRIAFDLGHVANRGYTSIKISYLPEFIEHGPGQLLNARLLQHLSLTQNVDFIDCLGPVSEATRKWEHDLYPLGRVTLSTGTLLSNFGVSALANLSRLISSQLVAQSSVNNQENQL